jgi:hypothetical protein
MAGVSGVTVILPLCWIYSLYLVLIVQPVCLMYGITGLWLMRQEVQKTFLVLFYIFILSTVVLKSA